MPKSMESNNGSSIIPTTNQFQVSTFPKNESQQSSGNGRISNKIKRSQLCYEDQEDLCFLVKQFPCLSKKKIKGSMYSKLTAERKEAWKRLQFDFNNHLPPGKKPKTANQLQKAYSNMVQRGKVIMIEERKRILNTSVDLLNETHSTFPIKNEQPLYFQTEDGSNASKYEESLIANDYLLKDPLQVQEYESDINDILHPTKKMQVQVNNELESMNATTSVQEIIDQKRIQNAELLHEKAKFELKKAELQYKSELNNQNVQSELLSYKLKNEKLQNLYWNSKLKTDKKDYCGFT